MLEGLIPHPRLNTHTLRTHMHTHPLTVSPFFFFVSERCVRSRCFLCPDCVCQRRGFVPTSGAAVSHKSAPSFSRYIDGGLSLCASLNPSHLLSLYFFLLSEHTPRRVNPSFLPRAQGSARRNPTETRRRSLRSALKKNKKRDVSHAHIFFPRFGIRLYFFGLLILFLSLIHEHLYSSQNKLLQNLQRTQVIKAKSALSELIFYYLSQSAPDSRPK